MGAAQDQVDVIMATNSKRELKPKYLQKRKNFLGRVYTAVYFSKYQSDALQVEKQWLGKGCAALLHYGHVMTVSYNASTKRYSRVKMPAWIVYVRKPDKRRK